MRLELSDGEMLELWDHEARALYETLWSVCASVGRLLLHANSVPLSRGLVEREPRLLSTNSRLKPCRLSLRMIDGAEAQR